MITIFVEKNSNHYKREINYIVTLNIIDKGQFYFILANGYIIFKCCR